MKRSEAVELILSKLIHLDLGKDNGATAISEFETAQYSDASQILEFIEEFGMLPPKAPMNILTGEDHYWEDE
jgi:hypothetical protein